MDDFEQNISNVGHLFDVLESFGMTINFTKTAALSQCRGSQLSKFNSKYIHRTKQGMFLRVPRGNGNCTEILLKSSHMYLGVMLSYRNASQLTMKCRISASKRAESVMYKWIFTHKGFSRSQRIRLWFQCIFPSVTAGILAVGVNQDTLQQFDSYCLHSLRKIYRQPVHIELLSHADCLTRFGLRDPLQMLRKLCHKMITRRQHRTLVLTSQDILHTATVGHLTDSLVQIDRCLVHRRSPVGPLVTEHPFQCHLCSATFESTRGLNEHLVKSHQDYTGKLRLFRPEADLVAGVPTCSRCGQTFTTWGATRHHVEYRCLLPAPVIPWEEKHWRSTELMKYVSNAAALESNSHLCKHFDRHCSLCGQFHSNKLAMKQHWKVYHPHEFQGLRTSYQHICASICFRDPCQFCDKSFPQQIHECIVLQNLAMLRLMSPKKRRRTQAGADAAPPETEQQAGSASDAGRTADPARIFDILRDQGPGFQCTHCMTSFPVSSALKRHIEQGHCQDFDPHKPHFVHEGLDSRILQSVKDHMISNILEDDDLLKLMNRQCCLCKQVFGRRGELLRHLQQQHATYWIDVQDTVHSLDTTGRGPTFRCYCQPPRYRRGQASKHQCVVFYQVALLMKHEQIEYCQQLVQMDHRYAETLEAARNQSTRPNGAARTDGTSTGRTLENYFTRTGADTSLGHPNTEQDPSVSLDDCQNVNIQTNNIEHQDTPLDDAEPDTSDTEDISHLIDYDRVVSRAIRMQLDLTSDTFLHWHWVITTDMSEIADQLQLSDMYRTLYPTTSLKLTGGFYAQWLDDPGIVRLLRTRCCICDATFTEATDMFYHHNIAHGCLPKWFLSNFDCGLKTLQWHLWTINSLNISDQDILQLCQLLVLRIHCASTFSHGGHGHFSADVSHLGGRHSQRPAEEVHSSGRRRKREETQGPSARSSSRRPNSESPIQCYSDDDDNVAASRGLNSMPPVGRGVCHSPEHWRREHPSGNDDGYQNLAGEQGQRDPIKTPPGLHDGDTLANQIPEAHGISRGQSFTTKCQEGFAAGCGREMPLSCMESGAEKTGDLKDHSSDTGRDPSPSGEHSEMFGGSKSHTSISQSQEAGGRSKESSAVSMGGLKQGAGGFVASPTETVLSRFFATYPNEPEARNSSTITSCSAAAEMQAQSVRVFCNSDGVSCYMNSFCVGLAWLGLHFDAKVSESTATDFGAFLKTCVQPTLVPLDVHLDFKDLLGNWLNSTRKGIQQDIHEYAEFFMECLQPVEIDGTWWPKWSLSSGPATDQQMDDYARGGKDSILSLTLPDSALHRCSLQALVNFWHDELGMCHVFTRCTAGKILHVDRQKESVKDVRPIVIEDEIKLPHSTAYDTATEWIAYKVCAITYHLGPTVLNGHYRTLLKQHHTEGSSKWLDYEDSKLPDFVSEPATSHLQNVTLIWLKRKGSEGNHAQPHAAQGIL